MKARLSDLRDESGEAPRPSAPDTIGNWLDVLERMLALPASRKRAIRAELEDHLRSRVDDLTITGMSEPEAVRAAVSELGETAELAERFRQAASVKRRRYLMHAAVLGLAGGAVALGTMAVTGGTGAPSMVAAGGAVAAAAGSGSDEAPRDVYGDMRRFSVHELTASSRPLEFTPQGVMLVEQIERLVATSPTVPVPGGRAGSGVAEDTKIVLLGNTLFVSGPGDTDQRVGWILESLHKDAARLSELRETRERESELRRHKATQRRENERIEVEDDLEQRRDELRTRLRELNIRTSDLSVELQELRFSGDSSPEEVERRQERFRQLQREQFDLAAQKQDLETEIERISSILLDVRYEEIERRLGGRIDVFSPTPTVALAEPKDEVGPLAQRYNRLREQLQKVRVELATVELAAPSTDEQKAEQAKATATMNELAVSLELEIEKIKEQLKAKGTDSTP